TKNPPLLLPQLSPDATWEERDHAIEQAYRLLAQMRAEGLVFQRENRAFGFKGPDDARKRWAETVINNSLLIFTALLCEELDEQEDPKRVHQEYEAWIEQDWKDTMSRGVTAMLRYEFESIVSIGVERFNIPKADAERIVHEVAAKLGFAIQSCR